MSKKIREQLVQVAGMMYNRGMVNAFEGNISVMFEGRIYITPSGVCKGFLSDEMIVVTDAEGNVIGNSDYRPSSEIKLHLATYRKRPNITSVIHAHSPYATAYAIANKPIETKAYPEMIVLFDRIPLARYGTPSTCEIYQGVEELILEHDVILLANHGIMAVGKDVFDAFFKLESVESIAKTLFIAHQLGGEKELPPDKLEELKLLRDKMHNKQ